LIVDRFTVFPFWSTNAKSGAVSPTFRFKAVLDDRAAGAMPVKAVAEPIKMAVTVAVNFIVGFRDNDDEIDSIQRRLEIKMKMNDTRRQIAWIWGNLTDASVMLASRGL
jgi:hypothetical protein